MKKTGKILAILISLAMIMGTLPSAVFAEGSAAPETEASEEARQMVDSGDITEDQVIIVFEEGVSASKAKDICEDKDVEVQSVSSIDGQKAVLAETDDDRSVAEAITEIDKERRVAYVQPNFRYTVDKADPLNNDTAAGQWYLKNIKAREAAGELSEVTGSKVKVAVIDSGADTDHEDLQKNLNKKLSVELDHMGGYYPLTDDKDGHGTHVTGIIAATFDNGKGIAGVSSLPDNKVTELFMVDAMTMGDGEGWFDSFDLVEAVKYVTDKGAEVFNMSIGGQGRDRYLEEAFEYAYRNDVVAVVAAGNEGAEVVETPSDYSSVISVCSTTKDNVRSYYSSKGLPKDISAPGTNILSTVPGDGYERMTGTSMAAPVVTSAAAAVRYANPQLTAPQVRNILCATADPSIGDDPDGFDKETGYGLLDMEAAVKAAKNASASVAPESIKVRPGSQEILIPRKDTYRMEPLVKPASSLAKITYATSNAGVATVDPTGLVTAQSEGTATITARAGSLSCEMTVHVDGGDVPEKVTLTTNDGEPIGDDLTIPSADSMENTVYPTIYLDGLVTPATAANKSELAWISSDMKVMTADEYGLLIGNTAGDTVLTVKTYNGKTDSVKIHVRDVAEKVSITGKTSKIQAGKTFTFKAKALPSDAADTEVLWKSSNRKTGTIGKSTGKFTAKNAGKTTITAYTEYGAKATVRVTVTKASAKSSGNTNTSLTSGPLMFSEGPGAEKITAEVMRQMIPERIKTELDKLRQGSRKGKNIKSASRDYLEQVRQLVIELIDEEMEDVLRYRERYCNVVWKEIMQAYDDCTAKVNKTVSIDELIYMAEVQTAKLAVITGLTKSKVKTGSAAELKKFKAEKISQLGKLYRKAKKAGNYNVFYSDRLEDSYYIGKKNINAEKQFGAAMIDYSTARGYIRTCKTVKAFAKYRKNIKKACRNEIIKPLVKGDYSGSEWKTINRVFDRQMAKIDKAVNTGQVAEIREDVFYRLFISLPANENYRQALYMKYTRMLDRAVEGYDYSEYSEKGYDKLIDIYYDAEEAVDSALTNKAEKKRALSGIAKMKKVPNYKQELTNLKKKYCKKLNSYVGNKKYVQKKVRPIVKAGKKAINKCTTIVKTTKTFKKYKKKADGTIKKFRIRSSAGRGGTITGSRTVKYGGKAVFIIKASKGYRISELRVDGKKVKIVKKYTFRNVRKNHSIKVEFR